jgi:hypothetical protein
MVSMQNEQEIIDTLKAQRQEILQHPKLKSLAELYSKCIDLHENTWLAENGIILKSSPPIDFKPLIDALGEENKRNEAEFKLLERCEDCINEDEEEQILYIKKNQLGMLTPDV